MEQKDEWMTEYYGRDWYRITNQVPELAKYPTSMVEWRVGADEHDHILRAQELGFTLVEISVEFETRIEEFRDVSEGVRKAEERDRPPVRALLERCYFHHGRFYNRFKNRQFFAAEQSERYYRSSLESTFNREGAVSIVAEDEQGDIVGFYTMRKVGEDRYRGALTGVAPAAKGRRLHVEMQRKCIHVVGRPYTVENVTQLSNYTVLNNHIREKRHLSKVEYIFLFKNGF